jgi:hypothetical protein
VSCSVTNITFGNKANILVKPMPVGSNNQACKAFLVSQNT